MARYIDIDEFRKKLFYTEDGKKIPDHDCDNFPTTVSLICLHHLIRNFPTADVAPRSEVAREVLAKVDNLAWQHKMQGHVSMDKFHDDIEELKQKYTEDQK